MICLAYICEMELNNTQKEHLDNVKEQDIKICGMSIALRFMEKELGLVNKTTIKFRKLIKEEQDKLYELTNLEIHDEILDILAKNLLENE